MAHTGIYIYTVYNTCIYRYKFYGYPSHIGNPLKLENGLITSPILGSEHGQFGSIPLSNLEASLE